MRSDLTEPWQFDEWPSPSPEDVVRERVRGRARSIIRRRAAPVLVALVLGSVAAVNGIPGGQSASDVHVTDSRTDDVEQAPQTAPADGVESVTGVGIGASGNANSAPPTRRGAPTPAGHTVRSEPAAGVTPLVVTDVAGDGRHVPSRRSEPALDWTKATVVGDSGRLHLVMDVADMNEPVDPTLAPASRVTQLHYVMTVEVRTGTFSWTVVRDLRDNSVTVEKHASGYGGPDFPSLRGWLDVERSQAVIEVDYVDFDARFASFGQPPLRRGEELQLQFATRYEEVAASSSWPVTTEADQMETDRAGATYRIP